MNKMVFKNNWMFHKEIKIGRALGGCLNWLFSFLPDENMGRHAWRIKDTTRALQASKNNTDLS